MQSDDLLKDTIFEGMGINPVGHDRWVAGVPHDPRSEALYATLESSDYVYGDDHFCWKDGGDGDNGETLMYGVDRHFWALDHGTLDEDRAALRSPKDAFGRPVAVGDIIIFGESRHAPSEQSMTVQRLERVGGMYWYAFGDGDRKVKLKDAARPFRIGLQWRGLLPEGSFEVGDYVVSEHYTHIDVLRVTVLRYTPSLSRRRAGQETQLARDIHAVVTPTHQAPPNLFRHATPEEMREAKLHHSIPTRFF